MALRRHGSKRRYKSQNNKQAARTRQCNSYVPHKPGLKWEHESQLVLDYMYGAFQLHSIAHEVFIFISHGQVWWQCVLRPKYMRTRWRTSGASTERHSCDPSPSTQTTDFESTQDTKRKALRCSPSTASWKNVVVIKITGWLARSSLRKREVGQGWGV